MTETTEKAAPNRTLYIVLGLVLAVAIAAGVADTGLAKALGRLAAGIRGKTPGP